MDKVDKIVQESGDVWKTRSAFFVWLKGCLRKSWNRHPSKMKLLKKNRIKIPNTNPKSNKRFPFVAGQKCSICGGLFAEKDRQVDHILEATASLTKLSDIQPCVEKLFIVSQDDLRVVCKDCHSIVSLSQKLGISFEEAKVEKKVIAHLKPVKECLAFLKANGYTGDVVSNEQKRRKLLREIFKGE